MFNVINWLVSALKTNYTTYRSDDLIYHFRLSADDVRPQQDPNPQRTSHTCTCMVKTSVIIILMSTVKLLQKLTHFEKHLISLYHKEKNLLIPDKLFITEISAYAIGNFRKWLLY